MSTDVLGSVREFPGECCEEVSRRGELQPCNKLAVAARLDVDEHAYPVCGYHARSPMVPLRVLLYAPVGVSVRSTQAASDE